MRRSKTAFLSKGIGDPTKEKVVNQTRKKFPLRKELMENPTNTQLDYERAILNKDTFRSELSKLRQQVSAGLEFTNNEYLRAILFSETANTTVKARFAFDHLFNLSQDIIQVKLLMYFFTAFMASSLKALNKKKLSKLG